VKNKFRVLHSFDSLITHQSRTLHGTVSVYKNRFDQGITYRYTFNTENIKC